MSILQRRIINCTDTAIAENKWIVRGSERGRVEDCLCGSGIAAWLPLPSSPRFAVCSQCSRSSLDNYLITEKWLAGSCAGVSGGGDDDHDQPLSRLWEIITFAVWCNDKVINNNCFTNNWKRMLMLLLLLLLKFTLLFVWKATLSPTFSNSPTCRSPTN